MVATLYADAPASDRWGSLMQDRRFLVLQGVCSPFFYRLASQLRAQGHQVFKILFNVGDWFYWGGKPAWVFRGSLPELEPFLAEKVRSFGITDLILFGDCRPVHRPAITVGTQQGLRIHVFEEGYFRPHWVTLERGGVNGYSRLPRDPNWYRDKAKTLPATGDGHPFRSSFFIRAAHDVTYHVASMSNPLFFPHYRTHAPVTAAIEYFGYLRRLPQIRLIHKKRDNAAVELLISSGTPYVVLPLQLDGDAQIKVHSPFSNMAEVMAHVLESFARHAPGNSKLIIKNHPLDPGLNHHQPTISALTKRFDLQGRIIYLETGNLVRMLQYAKGAVMVNSTVGTLALSLGCPTMALGNPIYSLPGLTFQGPLEQFWHNRHQPDNELFRCFRTAVIHATQVNGGFYSREGIDLLLNNCVPLLEADLSPLEALW